jgi:hypothetical protein
MENNMLKWYGPAIRMEDRWPKRIMTWSPEEEEEEERSK